MTDEPIDPNSSEPEQVTVLIVEDEEELADMYAAYLPDEYEIAISYGGKPAMEKVRNRSFDIVLLDRRMPVVSGNEVLAEIEEAKIDCRVAMVTAVNPDFDIIDLRIDDYLVKPVTGEELRETVSRLLKLDEYNNRLQQLTSKKLKRNLLQLEKSQSELSESRSFQELTRDIERLEAEVDSLAEELELSEEQ